MNTQKMEDAADIVISCGCEGCEEAVSTVCKGCGIATYCSAMHALEDWKNHAAECAYCVSSIAGASHWAVEMEVGQAAGSAQEKWVPSELVHARMDTSGLRVESTITNSQLVGDQANFSSNNGLFATTTLSVPRGKISRSSDLVTFRVLAATRTYEKVADFEYKLPAKSASRGVPGGRGMAFVLSESVIKGISRSPPAVLTQFEEAEQIYIVVTYRGRAWTIYGNFVIRPVQGFASLLSTATFRVKGQDKNGFTAALIFHRSAAFKSTAPGYQKFTLREIQVYIPEGNNGAEAGSENFPSGIAEPKAAPSGGAAAGVLSKIDAEVLEDVVALIDVLQDEKSSLSNEFIGAQAMGETKEIQGELSELTRIVNVLIEHADTLRAEEIGEKALVNISPVVFEAIRQGEEHIAANAFSQGFESARKRARDRREVNKEAKTLVHMRDQELADYFKLAVQNAESSRTSGAEGTPDLMRAQHALREIRKRKSIARLPAVLELTDRFKKLERTQGAARSVKRNAVKRDKFRAKKDALEAAQQEGGPVTLDAK